MYVDYFKVLKSLVNVSENDVCVVLEEVSRCVRTFLCVYFRVKLVNSQNGGTTFSSSYKYVVFLDRVKGQINQNSSRTSY